ncbi:LysR substrate-binding domain-containing protein [Pseudomaricurvus alkylphenolicus]|uniref:LysR substrate-binding domain-containing protein n=1 Tax=Pseudomaricurvus alkylphenolicus TaxID=1306991 RepID=UPI003B82D817
MQHFMHQFPGIIVRVIVSDTNKVVNLVGDDQDHLGLIFDKARDPNIRSKLSLPQPLKVIVHRNHPLAEQKNHPPKIAVRSQYWLARGRLPYTSNSRKSRA